ncbi:MAG: FHA domain-containing protein [Anaerolineae bacterium]
MTDETLTNCPHCGKKLPRPDVAFCPNCGTPLRGEAAQAADTVHGGSLAKIIINIPGEESREEFLSKAVTSLGRRNTNHIQIMSAIVSGQHAQIELTRQGHTLTDLRSTNGTYLNGKRLEPGQPYPLGNNDLIRFSDALGNSASLTYIAPSSFGAVGQAVIAKTFNLQSQISYIGRNPNAAIPLDHPAVSWNHARVIQQDGQRVAIADLSSNNGTFVNGAQLKGERTLERGDVVQIGPFNLVYQGGGVFAPYSAERNFRLEAVNLTKIVYPANPLGLADRSRPLTILQPLNLVINPREFVALVGGSGAGKSTLMKALSGVGPASGGTVLVNGDNLYANYNLYRNLLGYVPQDDIIHHNLEVGQALAYAARLRLPDATAAEIKRRVEEVLGKVGLTAQARTMVRDLSGGQRKRVSIAAELLAEPWIFFLDEPTSGLDPGLEKLMMDTLRQLADEGRTIILVTHATGNIANTCDQLAFMARGGELAYFGPPDQVMNFFQVDNFPDVYTRLSQSYGAENEATVPAEIKPEYEEVKKTCEVRSAKTSQVSTPISAGALWAEHYRRSALFQKFIANRQTGEMARPVSSTAKGAGGGFKEQLKQFGMLARRYFDLIRHDKVSLGVLLAVMPIIALFLLLISSGSALVGNTAEEIKAILDSEGVYNVAYQAQELLFMLALSANLLGLFAASFEIIKEEAIYRRERMINLRLWPYFASKFVVLAGFMLLQCLLLLLVLGLKIKYPGLGAVLGYYFTLVFSALASVALGLFLSALARSRDMVIYLVLLALFLQIVFSGAIFELGSVTAPLSYLTITRWSLEALGSSTDMEALNNLGQTRVEREIDLSGRGTQKVVEDVPTQVEFFVNYSHSALGVLSRWIFLWAHTLLWSGLALWLIKRKDEI